MGHSVQVVSTCWQLASGPRKAAALSNSVPVGQLATQAPHWVQVSDSANVWFMSTITRLRMPRLATSSVCAPSISSQVRTQRPQRMQRLWSMPKIFGGHVHRQRGIQVRITDAVNAVDVALVLQAAIALVVLAHGADVIAFAEQEFQGGLAQVVEPFALGDDFGARGRRGGAGRHNLRAAFDFDDAQAAAAPGRQAFHIAQRRNGDVVGAGDLQNGAALGGFAELAINVEGDFFGCSHGFAVNQWVFAAGALMSQRRQRKHSALACHSVKVGDTSTQVPRRSSTGNSRAGFRPPPWPAGGMVWSIIEIGPQFFEAVLAGQRPVNGLRRFFAPAHGRWKRWRRR